MSPAPGWTKKSEVGWVQVSAALAAALASVTLTIRTLRSGRRLEFVFSDWYLVPLGALLVTVSAIVGVLHVVFDLFKPFFLVGGPGSLAAGLLLTSQGLYGWAMNVLSGEVRSLRKRCPVLSASLGIAFYGIVSPLLWRPGPEAGLARQASLLLLALVSMYSFYLLVRLPTQLDTLGRLIDVATSGHLVVFASSLALILLGAIGSAGHLVTFTQSSLYFGAALALAPVWLIAGLASHRGWSPPPGRKPGEKMLVAVDVSADYASRLRDLALRFSRGGWILAITRKGSPVAKALRGRGRVALAYMVSGKPHPRQVGEWEFELAPSQPQILGMVSAAKESWDSFTMIFDSLTDLCALIGCDKARNLARELLRSLRSEDTLMMLIVEGAHDPVEERMFIQLVGLDNVVRLP